MAKGSGNTRTISPTSDRVEYNRGVFEYEISMPDVVMVQSYFSEKSGGYLLQMKNHTYETVEHEAMKHLADAGFAIVATPEGGRSFISRVKDDNSAVYPDGLIMGHVFELKSPKPSESNQKALDNSIKKSLNHARSKEANIAVIYDKNGAYNRDNIERGLSNYESKSNYRFKSILVIDKNGNVYEHTHNKK